MPTLSSMDEECSGPSKEMYSISVTANSCFICCAGGPCDQNWQCQDACVCVCLNVSDNGSVTVMSCNDGSSVILQPHPTVDHIMCNSFTTFHLSYKAG